MRTISYVSFAVASLVALSACSKDKEQCHALTLALTEADNAYLDLSAAATRGNRTEFEKAGKDFDAAVAKIEALEITGSGLVAKGRAGTRRDYVQAAPKIVPAYRHLLEAVEKNPKLGQKYLGGAAGFLSTDDVPNDVREAISTVRVKGSVHRKEKCD